MAPMKQITVEVEYDKHYELFTSHRWNMAAMVRRGLDLAIAEKLEGKKE